MNHTWHWSRVRLIFFEVLSRKVILSQPYVGWIRMKTCSPTNCPRPWDTVYPTTTENKFIVWNYSFLGPTDIYFFEFSSNESRIKCEICSKLIIEAPNIALVSLWLTLNIFDTLFHLFGGFFADLKHDNTDGIL